MGYRIGAENRLWLDLCDYRACLKNLIAYFDRVGFDRADYFYYIGFMLCAIS